MGKEEGKPSKKMFKGGENDPKPPHSLQGKKFEERLGSTVKKKKKREVKNESRKKGELHSRE